MLKQKQNKTELSDEFETAKETSLPLSNWFETDIHLIFYFRTCSKPIFTIPSSFQMGSKPQRRVPFTFRTGSEPQMRVPSCYRTGSKPILIYFSTFGRVRNRKGEFPPTFGRVRNRYNFIFIPSDVFETGREVF